MAFTFKKASRAQAKARIAIIGPSGSGKTMSALLIAHTLGERVAVIDTERGSASKYAGIVDPRTDVTLSFDVLELESFAPDTYVQAIEAAQSAGYDALVIDSLSHAWMGKDGALEQVDKAAKRSKSGNTFTAWRDVTPQHNRLVEALTSCAVHLIVTMRSKMEYVMDEIERGGKTIKQPRKVGMAPIQREGLEYEFDVVGDIDLDHVWAISKTRCPMFDGAVIDKPGTKFAETYRSWLQEGVAAPAPAKPGSIPPPPGSPPCFGRKLAWSGQERWAGAPLDGASLVELLDYRRAAAEALRSAAVGSKAAAMLLDHLRDVDAVIEVKEPHGSDEPDGDYQLANPAAE